MQLQFDFRFSQKMKEHLKQTCTSKFSYHTSANNHYLKVKSELPYSALPRMAPAAAAHLTKKQIDLMRDWRMKYGQSVPQKTVRSMSTKDSPGTLLINVARPVAHNHNLEDILYTAGEVVFLSSDARSEKTALYVLQQAIIASTKKTKASLFRGCLSTPLNSHKNMLLKLMWRICEGNANCKRRKP